MWMMRVAALHQSLFMADGSLVLNFRVYFVFAWSRLCVKVMASVGDQMPSCPRSNIHIAAVLRHHKVSSEGARSSSKIMETSC